jgi:heterodisulfide reductase subunit D
MDSSRIAKIIKDNSLYQCLECGKCSASCPRMLAGKEYSPRLLAQKLISERDDEAFIESSVWECLTCSLCEERCPSGVDISRVILEMRSLLAAEKGLKGSRAHDGALHSWMRMMTSPELKQNRLGWVTPELKTAETGKIAYFSGCAPYFDVFFSHLDLDTLSIARDSVRLLNFLDIEPVLLKNERCCGHDLLWTGDHENFETLCRLNYAEFKKAGIEEIVVSCPECYTMLGTHMPEVIPEFDIKVTLLLELLQNEVHKGGKTFEPLDTTVTYQDPCRLGRISGCYDAPRYLLEQIPGLTLHEMENSGRGAICCGNNGFINCDAYSKSIQVQRLKEVSNTGAELLVTACPKCMIHLSCAMRDPARSGKVELPIKDLTSLLAEGIKWTG